MGSFVVRFDVYFGVGGFGDNVGNVGDRVMFDGG